MYRSNEVPTGPCFGFFCAVSAVVMTLQLIHGIRKDTSYFFKSEVDRTKEPLKFGIGIVLNLFAIVFLAGLAIYAFMT